MTLKEFLLALRFRWRIGLGVFGAVVASVLIVNLLLPKQYLATASVVVDIKLDPIASTTLSGEMLTDFMATQVEILRSSRVVKRAVKEAQLDNLAWMQRSWRKSTAGQGDELDWVATLVQSHFKVNPAGVSNVIGIFVTWPDAKTAAALANALAEAYIATNIELKVDPALQYASSFDERAKQLRADLEAKQKRLSDFESQTGIVATDVRMDVETARLNELSSQLTSVQSQRQESQAKEYRATEHRDSLPEILQSPTIAQIKAQLSAAEARLEDIRTRLGANHPEFASTQAEVDGLQAQIASESAKIVQSIAQTSQVDLRRQNALGAAIEAQKQRILELRHLYDHASVLQNDVLTAQRNLDSVTQHLAQTSLEGQTQQTNVALLTAAAIPTRPARPMIAFNCILAGFVGIALGIAAALMQEKADARVRSVAALSDVLNVPLLGTVGRGSPQRLIRHSPNRAVARV